MLVKFSVGRGSEQRIATSHTSGMQTNVLRKKLTHYTLHNLIEIQNW